MLLRVLQTNIEWVHSFCPTVTRGRLRLRGIPQPYTLEETNLSLRAHVLYWRVNYPTLRDFYVSMIRKADIEGSKSNIAVKAATSQLSLWELF